MPERVAGEAAFAPAVMPLKRELSRNSPDQAQDEKRLADKEVRAKQAAPRPDGELQSVEMAHADAGRLLKIGGTPSPADASKQKSYFLADAQASAGATPSSPVPTPTASSLAPAKATNALSVNRGVLQAPAPDRKSVV